MCSSDLSPLPAGSVRSGRIAFLGDVRSRGFGQGFRKGIFGFFRYEGSWEGGSFLCVCPCSQDMEGYPCGVSLCLPVFSGGDGAVFVVVIWYPVIPEPVFPRVWFVSFAVTTRFAVFLLQHYL